MKSQLVCILILFISHIINAQQNQPEIKLPPIDIEGKRPGQKPESGHKSDPDKSGKPGKDFVSKNAKQAGKDIKAANSIGGKVTTVAQRDAIVRMLEIERAKAQSEGKNQM